MRNERYQVFQYSIASGSPASVDISENIDKKFKKITGIYIQTSSVHSSNLNLEVENPILINNDEIFPKGFDTFMLYPMMQHQEFTNFKGREIEINESKIEGKLKTIASVGTACTLKIILKLEN